MFPALNTDKPVRLGKNLIDVLGVVRPVGRYVQRATINQPIRDEIEECGLDDAPLVVPLLWPWIGKIKVQSGK